MKIVIPMAGKGSRFQAAIDTNPEYKKPKPFININGKPMIQWAMESLPFADLPYRKANTQITVTPDNFVFIVRRDHQEDFQIADKLKSIFSDAINIVMIEEVTRGAAETVYLAKEYIDTNEDIIISDSDHHFDGYNLYAAILGKDSDVKGIIPVFNPPDNDPKWSFSLIENGVITSVGEKDKALAEKGALANIGGYYVSHGKDFIKEVELAIQENDVTGEVGKEEFYVAPIFHRMIKKGNKIIPAVSPKVWGLGTPKDVEYFVSNFV